MAPHEDREGTAERRARPSDVSRDRLATSISGEVADIRVQLEETILRSEAFLAAGLPDQASAVVDEQQALLAELHERLDARISAAKVEADAEAVLHDTLLTYGREGVQEIAGDDAPAELATEPDDSRVAPLRAARGAASALVGAVAAIALMVMASSPPGPSTFAAAGVRDDRDTTQVPDEPDTTRSDDEADGLAPAAAPTADDSERAGGPNDVEIRKLFATPGSSEDPSSDDEDDAGLPVIQLQLLVANMVDTVEGVAEAARDGWERAFDERDRADDSEPAEDEPSEDDRRFTEPVAPDEDAPADEPQDAPEGQDAPPADASDEEPVEDGPDEGDADQDGTPGLEDPFGNAVNGLG